MITIYGKSACPYCQMAKHLCETAQLEHEYIDIFSSEDAQKKHAELAEKYKHRAVPLVLWDGEFVGGFTELQQRYLSQNGK